MPGLAPSRELDSNVKVVYSHWNGLHVSTLTPPECKGYLLFVHGGPGSHSGYFEAAVAELTAYDAAPFGWICYDQRSCGRSDASKIGPSHEENISDLAGLAKHLVEDLKLPILGIMGHSYGGWLAYHTVFENKDVVRPLIVVASAKDIRTAKNHSFAIDMLELRLDQPQVYTKLLPELDELKEPLWEFQKRIRKQAAPLKRRALFMWANLSTMTWYNAIKEKVGMPESWELTHEISSKISRTHLLRELNPQLIQSKMLRIMGAHDFLMDGDQYYPGQKNDFLTFLKSGHYPHFEEPERFVRELRGFLEL